MATTSVSGEQLERTFPVDLRDLTSQAPNVNLEPVGAVQNASAFYIRGFGSTDIESATDPGVGVFIDGVYQARTSTALSDRLDIANVGIVLRGEIIRERDDSWSNVSPKVGLSWEANEDRYRISLFMKNIGTSTTCSP